MRFKTILAAILFVTAAAAWPAATSKKVLVVMDEREQMEALAAYLKAEGGVESMIVDQASLPADWKPYHAVIGYIHGRLEEAAELKFIEYTRAGGRFVALHHTISSGKARNKHFFDFLGVQLLEPEKAREPSVPGGHYAWRDPVEQVIVNLRPDHYVTSHGVTWPERRRYTSSDAPSAEREYPAMLLKETEVYVNHLFTDGRAKTVLLGFRWTDDRNNQTYMQDRTGWYKREGKGWIFYFQPGHSTQEFGNRVCTRMILNAILWQPELDPR